MRTVELVRPDAVERADDLHAQVVREPLRLALEAAAASGAAPCRLRALAKASGLRCGRGADLAWPETAPRGRHCTSSL